MERGKGLRFNGGKLRYDLLHPEAISGLARVMTAGAQKYAERNWESGMKWTTVIASLKRHLAAIEAGEDFDPETGEKHIDHLQCNAHFLSAYYKIFPEGDDRPIRFVSNAIALDIDGVVANFTKAAQSRFGVQNYPNHWYYSYQFRNHELWEEVNHDKDFWLNIEPILKGIDMPFEPIAYVTQRDIPKEWTEEWIEKNNFPCSPVIVVNGSKADVLKKLKVEIFVDDRYSNFVDLNKAGIFTYLHDHPSNVKYEVGHRRIYSVKDIV